MWTYEQAKARRDELEAAVKAASDKLRAYPRGRMGLTVAAAKSTPEWHKDQITYQRAVNALRQFNTAFLQMFDDEIKAERAERRRPVNA